MFKSVKIDELSAKVDVWTRLASEAEKENAFNKAKYESAREYINRLESEIEVLRNEKKELLDELMVASGLRNSRYQDKVEEAVEPYRKDVPQYNQTRQWQHNMEEENGLSKADRDRRAIEYMAQLEQELENS